MFMEWEGVTPVQYDRLRDLVNWENDIPEGAMFHVASFSEKGLHVADVWQSAESFQRFTEGRLMPGVQQLGLAGAPRVELFPVHRLFTPAFETFSSR
jgi:hypothetical protein